MTISATWVDPDDYPEATSEQFDRAMVKVAGKVVRDAQEPSDPGKERVTLQLDSAALAKLRAGGPSWQLRINDAVRRAAGL